MGYYKNFAFSTIATPPVTPIGGLSLGVRAGEGSRFASKFPYYLVVCPGPPGSILPQWDVGLATGGNVEIVKVTAKAGDVLTLVRGQLGTSARAILPGDTIMQAPLAESFSDLQVPVSIPWNVGDVSADIFTAGRPDAGFVSPDLSLIADDFAVRMKGLWVGDIGDVGDIHIFRVYPDTGAYNQVPAQVPGGVNGGYFSWDAFDGTYQSGDPRKPVFTRYVAMEAKTVGTQIFGSNAGGEWNLFTVNQNDPAMNRRSRIYVKDTGEVWVQPVTSAGGTPQGSKTNLQIPDTTPGAGLTIGLDTNLYRNTAGLLATDGRFMVRAGVASEQIVFGDNGKILFGTAQDTNLYRSAADTLKTDDTLDAAGYKKAGAALASTHLSDTAQLVRTTDTGTVTGTMIADGTIGVVDTGLDSAGLAEGCFSAWLNSALSLVTATPTLIPFDSEDFDVSGWHDTVTNKGRLTPQRKCYYRISAHVQFNDMLTAGAKLILWLYKNGAFYKNLRIDYAAGADTNKSLSGSVDVAVNGSTDYLEIYARQDTGANKAIDVGLSSKTWWCGEIIGRSS